MFVIVLAGGEAGKVKALLFGISLYFKSFSYRYLHAEIEESDGTPEPSLYVPILRRNLVISPPCRNNWDYRDSPWE